MTKICTACHLTNRDVAIFCRGCAKRFASDHSQRDNDTAATSVLAIGIRPALQRTGQGARLWNFALASNWHRRTSQIDLSTLLLSAIVAGCAFLLWYMGRDDSLARPFPTVQLSDISMSPLSS